MSMKIDNDVNMNIENKKNIMEPFIGPLLSSFDDKLTSM